MGKLHRLENGGLITFEGPEGAGKTTQMRLLQRWLTAHGRECLVTREPGGTALGERLRRILKRHRGDQPLSAEAELLLFAAARAQHVRELIAPAVARGAIVLCDRFSDSTLAYQGFARGLDRAWIRRLNDFAVGSCRPRLTILLDLPPEEGARRAGRRSRGSRADRFEAEGRAFHRRVRNGFLELARAEPARIKVVSAARPRPTVQQQIQELVSDAFGRI